MKDYRKKKLMTAERLKTEDLDNFKLNKSSKRLFDE